MGGEAKEEALRAEEKVRRPLIQMQMSFLKGKQGGWGSLRGTVIQPNLKDRVYSKATIKTC